MQCNVKLFVFAEEKGREGAVTKGASTWDESVQKSVQKLQSNCIKVWKGLHMVRPKIKKIAK